MKFEVRNGHKRISLINDYTEFVVEVMAGKVVMTIEIHGIQEAVSSILSSSTTILRTWVKPESFFHSYPVLTSSES